ncbi:MAG: hypothetical protein EOM34_00050 [Clostridia bacterium]|nr:hypothetical protein [Lachnospiraceae bacterium]NCB99057.1 hypothetical protein [Clostridia bacterium]NCD03509.1 hypothetical protein [Clostridia bacterium]
MALFLVFTVWLIDLCLCIIGDMTQTIYYASIGIILILILYMAIKLIRDVSKNLLELILMTTQIKHMLICQDVYS